MSSELDDDMGDFDPNASANSDDKVDSVLIKKILYEMKSEFNRGMCNIENDLKDDSNDILSSNLENIGYESNDSKQNGHNDDTEIKSDGPDLLNESFNSDKEEPSNSEDVNHSPIASIDEPSEERKEVILKDEESDSCTNFDSVSSDKINEEELTKKKNKLAKDLQKIKSATGSPVHEGSKSPVEKKGRRSLRNADKPETEVALKRSSRRMSKEYSRESVLQNAIARKEKSFSSLVSAEEKRRSSRTSDERNSKKSNSKSAAKAEEQFFRGFSDSKTSSKGKPSIPGDINEIDSDNLDNGFQSSTPKKNVKHFENGFEEELSNHASSNQQSESECDKGSDNFLNFSSSSVKAKKKTFSFSNECYQPLAKRPRRDTSPLIPEASDVPPNEPSLPLMAWSSGVCECQRNDGMFPSKASLRGQRFCKALDSFEDRVIGCMNKVGEDTPLLRPSPNIPLLLMCEVHISRLIRHNACPSCGLFCIQGQFLQCKERHFFHEKCAVIKDDMALCPHCESEELSEVKLSLSAHQYPVFLPSQKLPNRISARMSINRSSYPDDEQFDEDFKNLISPKDLPLNKKKFSTEGLPASEKEKLEKLLHVLASRNDLFPRAFSGRAFYQACKHGDVEKVYTMLGSYNKENGTLQGLHAAAGNGHLTIVHLLVQSGMSLEVLDKSQYTPLMLATLNGHNSVVKYLVKAGADVSFKGSDGMTALHLAAQVGNLEACHYLLSAANKPLSFVDTTDDGKWTPLVWAAENNHGRVVRYLLEKKADPHIKDSEMNVALHWSAFAGSMEITEDLINYGSNVNVFNSHGDSPLHIAARQGAENCVMLLLARGASTDQRNSAGQLPKDCVLSDFPYCKTAIELNMKLKSLVAKTFFLPRILSNDISRGQETNPIQCINNIDAESCPSDFIYIAENCVTSNLPIDRRITSLTGCKCEDTCTTASCQCSKISYRCWYDSHGKLLPEFNFDDPPMIFECNQTCSCHALTCKNRVVQKGISVRLQVCKTRSKNWGVITLREIPKGTYVCEYVGEIISDFEAETREDDSYLFDLDNRDGDSFCIDACKYGNVTRFVNHSCKPNLVPVRIFVGHHDLHFPRIAFFAARDIAPNEELGFDYGEKFWVIKYKNFLCSCEEISCKYSEKTIHATIEKYNEKLKLEESV